MQANPTPVPDYPQQTAGPKRDATGDPLAALDSIGLPARAVRLARVLFRAPFGRPFDPDDPVFLARPAVRSACLAAGVPVGALVAWPTRERIGCAIGRSERRLHLTELTGGPDAPVRTFPIRWERRTSHGYVLAPAEGGRPGIACAHARDGGTSVRASVPPSGPPSARPGIRAAFEVRSDLRSDLREEERESLAPVLRPSFPAKAEATATAAPAPADPLVNAIVDAYRAGRDARQRPPAWIRDRARRQLETMLRETGLDLPIAVAGVSAYLDSSGHWEREGWPLRGYVEDIERWTSGRSSPAISGPPQRRGPGGAPRLPRAYNRARPDDLDSLPNPRELEPEPATAAAPRQQLDPEAAAALARELAHERVRIEHDRAHHVGRIEHCGRCSRQLADLRGAS